MKYKILGLAIIIGIIYSCASKTNVKATLPVEPNPKLVVAKIRTAEWAEGKSLYENNCAKCHDLYNATDFSAAEWKPIVARMQEKAHLDDLSGQKIYSYLTAN